MKKNIEKREIAIVSGALGFIGLALVHKLVQDGFYVIAFHRNPDNVQVKKKFSLLKKNYDYEDYFLNLENEKEVILVLNQIKKNHKNISVCIHTAGIKPQRKKIFQCSVFDLKESFKNNVLSSFNFLKHFSSIVKMDGIVIGLSSTSLFQEGESKNLGAYVPTKFAVHGILKALRDEINSINIYSLAPGFMEGGMNSDIPRAFVDMIKNNKKSKKIATPEGLATFISNLLKTKNKPKDFVIFYDPD